MRLFEENVDSIYEISEKKPTYLAKKPRWLSDMHIHKEYELIRVSKGIIRCITLNEEYIIKDGDVLFINSNIPHKTYDVHGATEYSLVRFNSPIHIDSVMRYIDRFAKASDTPICRFKAGENKTSEICEIVDSICEEKENCLPLWRETVQAYIMLLLAKLRRMKVLYNNDRYDSLDVDKIRPVLEYIDLNYSENLSTSKLAEILNFNETYFCRLFRRAIGTTTMNYLNFVRICKAEALLKKGSNISDAAYATGFSSLSYFNRTFKKFKQYSPREYKDVFVNQHPKDPADCSIEE